MTLLKNIFASIGFLLVASIIIGILLFGPKLSKLDTQALPEYIKMFTSAVQTGDPAKSLIRKVKMQIPQGMTKKEAIANAIKIMDTVAQEHGFRLIDYKTLARSSGLYTHMRSYCSPTIADTFLTHSREFIGFMPCRIGLIEEPNGDIYIYTMDMKLLIHGGYRLNDSMLSLANKVRSSMYEILDKAAKGEE